jgi:hypothetical protein
MSDFIFNQAKGRIASLGALPAANDAFIWVPIETTGLESDATLIDYDDLSALLAASNNEQTTLGRKTATSVTVTVDDANDRVDIDADDPTWTGAGGNGVSKLLLCYDGDTTSGTDANITPVAAFDWVIASPSGTIGATLPAGGCMRAS